MSSDNSNPLPDIFIYETNRMLEQVEGIMLAGERAGALTPGSINEIFRAMHTIKGSAAMMSCEGISRLAHAVEDMFHFIRENNGAAVAWSDACDLVLQACDFIRGETAKIASGMEPDGRQEGLSARIHEYLGRLASAAETAPLPAREDPLKTGKGVFRYTAHVAFEEGCRMENIRAFGLVYSLKDLCAELMHRPEDLLDDDAASDAIVKHGFDLSFTSGEDRSRLEKLFDRTMFVKSFTLEAVGEPPPRSARQQISVDAGKLDNLMALAGEIAACDFRKNARHLSKLTRELKDLVMSMRMIPVANAFHSMERIVRDMGKKLGKEAELSISGENTEADRSIIDNLSDPLMHLVRNAMDHGLEQREERLKAGKPPVGRITLSAANTGSGVLITVSDDGRGIDREKILRRARERSLLQKAEADMTDRDVFSLILLPGFSTKDEVTEFSGRGVGMDVVRENIEKVGGSVSIESEPGQGTTVTIRIPQTRGDRS